MNLAGHLHDYHKSYQFRRGPWLVDIIVGATRPAQTVLMSLRVRDAAAVAENESNATAVIFIKDVPPAQITSLLALSTDLADIEAEFMAQDPLFTAVSQPLPTPAQDSPQS